MANYREPQWLLPNEKNLAMPASDATVGSGLAEDRQSLYSMDFDSTNYIDVGTSLGNKLGNSYTGDITVSMWFNADTVTSDDGLFTIKTGSSFGNITFLIAGSTARMYYNNDGTYISGSVATNQWYNLVGVLKAGDASNTKLYLNGSLVATATTTPSSSLNFSGMETWIGNYWGGSNSFDGKIDEVAIWNRALSAGEVSALITANAPANILALSDKPIAYWPLGEQARLGSEWQFPNEVLQSQVFDFDGTDDVVDLGTGLIGDGTKSISFWIKRNSGSPSNDGGIFTIVESGSPSSYISIALWQDLIQSSIGNSTNHKGSTTIAVDTWYHVMVVKDSSATTAIYVNGVAETLSTGGSWVGAIDQPQAKIGGISYSSTSYNFQGEISNVAVWYSDQSANIANIYNNGSPQSSYTTTPTAWYKLNATSNYAGLNPNFHNALSFDGSSDYIDCGSDSSLSPSSFTFSVWSKSDLSDGGWVTKYASENYGFGIYSGSIYLNIKTSAGWGGLSVTASSYLTAGKWHHIVGTYDETDLKIYVDGNLADTLAKAGPITYSSQNTRIGNLEGTSALDFNGSLSNVAIYNQVISAEDVLYLYNGGTPQTSLSFEPLSWWKLDNLTTGIQDSGSASNNGTNNGATAVSSSVAVDQWNFDNVSQAQTPNWSSALFFDGTNDYIDCGNDSSLQISQNISISVWFRCTDQGIIFSKGQYAGETAAAGFNYSLSVRSPGYGLAWQWYTTSSDGSSTGNRIYYLATTGKALTVIDGLWHNIVVTRSASSSKLYLDGEYIASTGNTATDLDYMVNSSQNVRIGDASNGVDPFPGDISNVQVWNTQLTDADALSIYNTGQPSTTAVGSPQAWWKLDSTTITDSSGNGNTGTNNGATEIQTNVWTPRLNGESTTLPTTALVSSDLQFESPYSNFSLEFDGIGNNLNLGNVQNNISLTFSSWINTTSTNASSYQNIAWKRNGSTGWFIQYLYGSGTDGKIKFYVFHTNGAGTGSEVTITNLQSGNWFNISLTYDGTDAIGALKLYSNGVEVYSNPSTLGGTGIAVNSDNLYLGGGATSAWFGCKMDEVAIWGSALTQAQVTQIYNNGYPSNLTSLSPSNWWRLGEDAYFVSNDLRVPNQISGGNIAKGYGTQTTMLVADAPGSYASGVGDSLVVADRIGDAPESTANSLSVNMTPLNRVAYPPGYAPTQVDNVYSMDFDGSNDYVEINPATTIIGSASLSVWFKTSSSAAYQNIVGSGGGSYPGMCRYLTVKSGKLNNYVLGVGWIELDSTAVNDGNWHHLVFTYDSTTTGGPLRGTFKAYVDGSLTKTYDMNGSTENWSSNSLATIGNYTSAVGRWFNGTIDEVAIFDYVLSARQVKQDIYEGTTTGKTADLNNISNLTAPVAWYRMGD